MFRRLRDYLTVRYLDPVGTWLDSHAETIVRLVWHRATRLTAAWVLALLTAFYSLEQAWFAFDDAKRNDGNYGHSTIDFGGQWMMGAMLVQGHGRQLYNRDVQREVLRQAYDRSREDPKAEASDADKLMSWFMGSDSRQAAETIGSFALPVGGTDPVGTIVLLAGCFHQEWVPQALDGTVKPRVGGPLYPPINSLVYSPLGMMSPPVAYRVNQVLNLVWALIAALAIRYLTRGAIWVPVALTIILLYPGFKGSIHLGQNAALTLAILTWGWALIARDHPWGGGLVWGLLAFKPVWAAAFFIVPLLTGRWRTCLAMIGMGGFLAVLTLPLVGIGPWFDWLQVGKEAAELYKTDVNWVFLSRDVLGIPRRFLLDFSVPSAQREVVLPHVVRGTAFVVYAGLTIALPLLLRHRLNLRLILLIGLPLTLLWLDWGIWEWYLRPFGKIPAGSVVGWTMLAAFMLATAVLVLFRRREAGTATGIPAAFLLIGAWLGCFHFMYYDVLLTALPMFVLLAEPRQLLQPIVIGVSPPASDEAYGNAAAYYQPVLPAGWPYPGPVTLPDTGHCWILNRMAPTMLALLLVVEHLFPHLGIAGTVTGFFGSLPLGATTVLDNGTRVLIYQQVGELATWRVSTQLYAEGYPWDTFCIIGLWMWCGFLWLRMPRAVPGLKPEPAPSLDLELSRQTNEAIRNLK